jgi:hypothetical protein
MKEKIISGAVANWFSIGVLVAVGIVVFPIYLILYGWQSMDSLIGGLLMALGIIVAIVAHELIHGLFFCIFTKDWHSVTFGFNRHLWLLIHIATSLSLAHSIGWSRRCQPSSWVSFPFS